MRVRNRLQTSNFGGSKPEVFRDEAVTGCIKASHVNITVTPDKSSSYKGSKSKIEENSETRISSSQDKQQNMTFFKDGNNHLNIWFKTPSFKNQRGKTRKVERRSALIENLENFKAIPSDYLETKMDYFFTPYNKGLYYQKHMDFDNMANSDPLELSLNEKASGNFKKLMDFITKEDTKVFRKSLKNINKTLYLELYNIHKKEERIKKKKTKDKINASSRGDLK